MLSSCKSWPFFVGLLLFFFCSLLYLYSTAARPIHTSLNILDALPLGACLDERVCTIFCSTQCWTSLSLMAGHVITLLFWNVRGTNNSLKSQSVFDTHALKFHTNLSPRDTCCCKIHYIFYKGVVFTLPITQCTHHMQNFILVCRSTDFSFEQLKVDKHGKYIF